MDNFGFFYYEIDSNDLKILNDCMNFTINFFSQSLETKLTIGLKNGEGYAPLNKIKLNNHSVDAKESYTYRYNKEDNTILNKCCQIMEKYAKKILSKMDLVDFENLIKNNFNTLALIHYPKLSDEIICGSGVHTDWGLITLLFTTSEGLQIKVNDEWFDVPIKENHFIVNYGDMLEILSEGNLKSTEHRVMVKNEKFSIVFFFEPALDYVVKGDKEIKFGDYVNKKIKKSYG